MPLDFAQLLAALRFDSATRLYRLEGDGPLADLMVEAWSLQEALDAPWTLELSTLATDARLDIHAMLGQKLTLQTALADGSLSPRSGIVTNASAEESDGGFARYRLTVRPWIALLAHTRRSQVWQEKTLIEIVESVFARYGRIAQWRWADDVAAHLAQSPFNGSGQSRSYTVQYRETDLAFVTRLLAEDAIAWRVEENPDAPAGHGVVLFADSPAASSCPDDPTSQSLLGGSGIRFHRSAAVEEQDTIQALGSQRVLQSATTTVLAWDYAAKRAVAASVPTNHAFGGANAPRLESYDPTSAYAFATTSQADRAATLLQEAIEARNKTWLGRSTVRTFRAGTTFNLKESTLDALASLGQGDDARRFLLTAVTHAGINNLPKDLSQRIAARLEHGGAALLAGWVPEEVRAQAVQTGYGNAFDAIRASVPWRPAPTTGSGQRLNPKPTTDGPLIATVVGADGGTGGTDEIHTDRLGRIRIRHDFQPEGEASTWVRVLQRYAGAGMGQQFIPRIGQQVLVDFIEGDIDRPLVVGALYDGKGEAGTPATPGGQGAEADTQAFAQSSDHSPSAQGNTTGGNAPPWHGASPAEHNAGGQRNAAAMSGWKTKEFNGSGHNQLVFDDSDQQLRVQLASTQHASQLNLGHLIHQADNHRGSFRGLGFELRTDAYGTIRAKQGVLISSFGTNPTEAAGDNAAGIALAKQLKTLGQSFSQAAGTHQTVKLAGQIGSFKANQSSLSDKEAPLGALHTSLKGMVDQAAFDPAQGDAASKNTRTEKGKLPHPADPMVTIAAKAGLAMAAGQDVQFAAGETITIGAGQDYSIAAGGSSRIHAGQAIGVLAGAVGAGSQAAGKGITLIAGQGDIEFQAQSDTMQIAAKNDVTIQSANAHIDWAAAKKIVLATAGGANITIEGGNITVMCPGKITVRASQKSFVGPEGASYAMPRLVAAPLPLREWDFDMRLSDTPGTMGHALAHTPWKIAQTPVTDHLALGTVDAASVLAEGTTDSEGRMLLSVDQRKALAERMSGGGGLVLIYPGHAVPFVIQREQDGWSRDDRALSALRAWDFTDEPYSHVAGVDEQRTVRDGVKDVEGSAAADLFAKLVG